MSLIFSKNLFTVSCVLALQACSSNPIAEDRQKTAEAVSQTVPVAQEKQDRLESESENRSHNAIAEQKMTSAQMLDILQAELLVRKGAFIQAFDLYYDLAGETGDPEILKRTFKLSMVTYDVDRIRRATELWKKMQPEVAIAWRASFLLKLRAGEIETALSDWQTYHQLSQQSLEKDLLISSQRVAASVPAESGLLFLELLVENYPENWASHFGMAMVASAHQMPQLAIEALQQSLKFKTEDSEPKIYQSLAKLYVDSSQAKEGVEVLMPYVERFPEDFLVQERLARLEVMQEKYDAAEARYQLILEGAPESTKSRLSLALLQMELKEFKKAIENLDVLVQQEGYQAVAYYYKGISLQELKRYQEALTVLQKVSAGVYQVDAILHRAEILFAEKRFQEAYAELEKIPTETPENKVKKLRAKAIFKSFDGQYQQALDLYKQVLEIEPSNVDVLLAKSFLHYNQEDFAGYESTLLKALKINGSSVEALNGLGYFYTEQGIKLDQAEVLLKRALALDPDSYYVLDSLGWLYYQKGMYPKAIEFLERAFAIKVDEEVFSHLVQAYLKNGQKNKAQNFWREHYNNFEDQDVIRKLKSRLPEDFVFE